MGEQSMSSPRPSPCDSLKACYECTQSGHYRSAEKRACEFGQPNGCPEGDAPFAADHPYHVEQARLAQELADAEAAKASSATAPRALGALLNCNGVFLGGAPWQRHTARVWPSGALGGPLPGGGFRENI